MQDSLAKVHDRMVELVDDRLGGENYTIEIVEWDDGDFQIEAFHSVAAYDEVTYRESLFYDSGEGRIRYREYMLSSDEQRYVVRKHDIRESDGVLS